MKYLQLRFTPSHSLRLALNALLPLFFLLSQSYTLYSVYFISLPTSVFPPMSQFPKANALEQIIIHTLHPASILASQTTSLSSMCAQWTCIDAGGEKTKITYSVYSDKWGHICGKQAVVVTLLGAFHPITKIDPCYMCVCVSPSPNTNVQVKG